MTDPSLDPRPNPGVTPAQSAYRQEHLRQEEAAVRAQVQRRRRTRLLIQLVIGVVVVVVIGGGVLIYFVATHTAAAIKAETAAPAGGPKNMLSGGILMTGKAGAITAVRTPGVEAKGTPTPTDPAKYPSTANIIEFIDYQCPYCNQFETANAAQITKWVGSGTATVEIHPMAFLDASSRGTRYSSRADNAASCVANYDPDDFLAATSALYAHQPPEGSTGLPNSQIVSILAGAGASGADITRCVTRESFRSWVTSSTKYTINSVFGGQVSTPTVFVNGKQYSGSITDPTAFAAFVSAHTPVVTS